MVASLAEQVVSAIRAVVGPGPTSLHEPIFDGNEGRYLQECLTTTFVASAGRFTEKFESELAAYTGANHVICTVNGTAALHIALKLAGVQSGDEVLVPALTFVATGNAVTYCGAIPNIVDCDKENLGIDTDRLDDYLERYTEQRSNYCINVASGRRIKAVVPMHVFGHPMDIDGVLKVARDNNLVVIEDAAESLGSFYQGGHTGTFGTMGILSFNGNKIITSGGGGAILTNDLELAQLAKHLTTTAKVSHRYRYQHDQVGYNYRLPNLNAALGCAQLEQLPKLLLAKRKLGDKYQQAFADVSEVSLVLEPPECQSNYWLHAILLDESMANLRDEVVNFANDSGYEVRPPWDLLSDLQYLDYAPRMKDLRIRAIADRLINVPSSPGLGFNDGV
jgi:perosamine synthetase